MSKKFKARDGSPRQQLLEIIEKVELGFTYFDAEKERRNVRMSDIEKK